MKRQTGYPVFELAMVALIALLVVSALLSDFVSWLLTRI